MEKHEAIPLVRFGLKEEKVYFNHAVLTLLGNPKFVQLLYNKERKLLLVAGNNAKHPYSLAIPKNVYEDNVKDFRICHKHLTEAFMLRLGWDKNENYSVTGLLSSNVNMVVFELARATKTDLGQEELDE